MSPTDYRALLDEAQDKIVVLDDEGTYQYANAAVQRILGYDPDEMVGNTPLNYVHPNDHEDVMTAFRAVTERGEEPQGIEYRHRAADGSWIWLESRMADHSNSDLGGYVVSSRDITDRKEAELARERTVGRLREIAGNTSEVLWMFDADWSALLFVNDAFEELWGIEIAELREDPTAFLDGVHPEDHSRVRDAMARLSAGEHVDIEYRVNPSADYRHCVWVRGAPIFEDGEVVRITGFAREITDRRRRERQLKVIDRLLRHNLRNELNVVIGRAELAADAGSPEVREHAATINRVCRSVLATAEKEREIVSLLSAPSAQTTVDVADLARRVANETSDDADVFVDAPETASVSGVEGLDLALTELVENAVAHATTNRPSVDITVDVDDGVVRFAVWDRGARIPPEDAGVLLGDRDASALSHGSGLGLWLVHWAIELSNGSVSLTRRRGGGNVITLTLQRASAST